MAIFKKKEREPKDKSLKERLKAKAEADAADAVDPYTATLDQPELPDDTEISDEEIERFVDEGMIQQSSTITQILDPNNTEPIVLFSEEGFKVEFEQIALVPLDNNLYVILRPLAKMDGVNESEAIVFRVDYDSDEMDYYLNIETNNEIIDETFKIYSELFTEEERKFKEKIDAGK